MPTMFDLLGYPGKSAYAHQETNLTDSQAVALHKARSLCQLLMDTTYPVSDILISQNMSFDALNGTLWLLRDLLDEAGKPDLSTQGE